MLRSHRMVRWEYSLLSHWVTDHSAEQRVFDHCHFKLFCSQLDIFKGIPTVDCGFEIGYERDPEVELHITEKHDNCADEARVG